MRPGQGDIITEYQLVPRTVEMAAGVNAYPASAPDTQLFGRSVAATEWTLAIPPGKVAPANADVDATKIEDIVFKIEHRAISLSPDGSREFNPSCGL